MTGHLFGDRYQVGDTLGFGGMSEVHRGRDLRLGRDVAIKVLRADLARDPSFQARFRREAQNAASLNHPAIVAVYDTGETKGETGTIPYIVMEYVDGETLRDLLKREGPLAPKRAMEIVADVCAALDFSHRHGIVHRDIKPANVMLTRAGAVKVMDFGIARAVADGQATMTATAAVIGTAQYLSPEQARGEAVDARSDVYSTGCVLFELLTGAPPFTGDSPVAVAYQHVREDPKAPSEVKPGLPKELDAIVLKALNKNPLNRYQTAAEMRSDLVRALSGQAVHATPVMSDEERTQMLRPGPVRVGQAADRPPLLAPPRRPLPSEMWDDDPEPNRSKKVWGFVGIGLLCAVLLAGAIFLTIKVTSGNTGPKQVAVPQVFEATQASAVQALTAAGLQVGTINQVESPDADKGKVTKQVPSQGTFVDSGSKVDLEIGRGQTSAIVPDLSGMSAVDAKSALAVAKLGYTEVQQKSDGPHKGLVIGQNPKANAAVKPNSSVTVTIGLGQTYVLVPNDLLNPPISYDDAANKLKAVGLVATKQVVDGLEPKDQVKAIGGNYQAGVSSVPQGTIIPLLVSNNQLFTMPDLTNDTVDSAAVALKAAGWQGTAQTIAQNPFDVFDRGLVGAIQGDATQSPAAGTPANKNTPVSVKVGKPAQVTMPGVLGVDVGTAEQRVSDARLSNVNFTKGVAASTPDQVNKVYATTANEGDQKIFDDSITITYYGPIPPPPTTPKTTAKTTTPPSIPPGPSGPPGQTVVTSTKTVRPGG